MPGSSDPRILVLGAGSAGSRHARNLMALGARVAVADVDARSAASVAGAEALPVDLRSLDGFDGVVVATPTSFHRDHALAALRAGAAVLVEKPLSASTRGLDELVEAAGDRLTVGYNLRLHPPVQRLRELVASGVTGGVALVRAWFGSHLPDWRPHADYRTTYSAHAGMGGGVLRDASHELDLLVWLFGADWTVEGAVMTRRSSLDVDVEDVVTATLRSRDGLPAELSLDYVSRRYRRGLEVVGERRTVRLDWALGRLTVEGPDGADDEDATPDVAESYRREAAAFLGLVSGREPPLVTAEEGAATVRLCAAVEEAAGWRAPRHPRTGPIR